MATVREQSTDAVSKPEGGDGPSLVGAEATAGGVVDGGVEKSVAGAAAAEAIGVEYAASLAGRRVAGEFLSAVSIGFARRWGLVGLAGGNGCVTLAAGDVRCLEQVESVARLLGKPVEWVLAPRGEILRAINLGYQAAGGRTQQIIEQLNGDDLARRLRSAGGNEDLLDVASRAPVIKLVNLMLLEAVKHRASDLHVQPYEDRLVVRLRVDGVLHDIFHPPQALQDEIISRIKVMGGMNIAERRLAQDGRATVEVGDRVVDLRIATLPTSFGERAVVRLLDKSIRLYELGELGMPPAVLGSFRRLIRCDHGIVLVTGPTGSGKSTTLYAALGEIDSRRMNVLTLEDPIEYRLEGISQTQVSARRGMTFSSGLRHVLRQDPDIIMVGEIRDGETARMAIQSALTGHLVFSTLHTNDAAGAVARMLDLGVESYLLASSLLAVLAQRLVRRICPACKTAHAPSATELAALHSAGNGLERVSELHRGAGCDECMGTGYRERIGVFELLTVSESVRELILHSGRASAVKAAAISAGMKSLWADGVAKAAAGITTMDEVARVASPDES